MGSRRQRGNTYARWSLCVCVRLSRCVCAVWERTDKGEQSGGLENRFSFAPPSPRPPGFAPGLCVCEARARAQPPRGERALPTRVFYFYYFPVIPLCFAFENRLRATIPKLRG